MRRRAKWTPPLHIGPVPHVLFLDRRRHMTDGRFATRYTPGDGGGASGFARRSRCCFYVSVSPSAKGARVEGRGPAESRGQRSEVRGRRSEGAVASRFQCGCFVRLSGFRFHPSSFCPPFSSPPSSLLASPFSLLASPFSLLPLDRSALPPLLSILRGPLPVGGRRAEADGRVVG